MRLAMAQISMRENMSENVERTLNIIREAKDADLLFFPEIQLSPFFPQYKKAEAPYDVEQYALKRKHPYVRKICEAAAASELYVSPNLYLKKKNHYYDASLWITPKGELEGVSTMVHVLQAEHFFELDYYTTSEDGFHVYETPYGKIGIVICFDRHMPESIRTCARAGAQFVIVPTANLKIEPMELFEWEMRVQAMQNNVFIAMCNRVGQEGELCFAGESIVIDPDGNVVVKADDREQILYVELDLAKSIQSRRERPYLTLRRPEMYRVKK